MLSALTFGLVPLAADWALAGNAALRFARAKPVEPHLDLGHDEWFPVAAPSYLATLRQRALPKLFGEAMLLSHSRHAWEPWFREAGLPMPRSHRVTTFTDTGLMLDAAIRGQGIAYGRRSLLLHLLKSGQLVRLSPVSLSSAHSYYLMVSERFKASPEVRVVHGWIKALVGEG
ncbi:LysR substrate-binding domain-containing protein [Cupriavidus basilensis]|uniref:LysR substrate-binding domain-containing protein n=1 Tax=Cupriavidus basilensis TaxID=68895 RepID=UPI0039F6FC72